MNRQALMDLVVALLSVPLLVVFGLMLESNMRGDWTMDADTRWHVLGLGLSLLFISLLVMGYVTHRLGICIWQASQTDELLSGPRSHRSNGSRTSNDSQLHLVVSGELPPSYESVVTFDNPPPYCSILVFDEKIQGFVPTNQLQQAKTCNTCVHEQQQQKQSSTHQSKQAQQQYVEAKHSKQTPESEHQQQTRQEAASEGSDPDPPQQESTSLTPKETVG